VSSGFADQTFEKWVDWIKRIDREVLNLHYRRIIWRGTLELIHSNEVSDGHFVTFLTQLYIDGQTMAIRRQATDGSDSISMARLLREMSEHPNIVSRDRFLSLWHLADYDELERHDRTQWANEGYDKWAGSGDTIPTETFVRDLEQLNEAAQTTVGFATRTVAHLDRRGWDKGLTFGELTSAIDVVTDLHSRYYHLLTAAMKGSTSPFIQGDWRAPFRQVLTGRVDEDDARLDY
jgi:hypothetical protein